MALVNETASRCCRVIDVRGASATVIAATLLWGTGCTHDAPPTTPPANAAPRHAEDVGDLLALIPAQVSLVLQIDGNQFRDSPIYTQFIAGELAKSPEFAMVQHACGFDPVASITSLTVAAMGGMSGDGGLELLVRGIPRDRAIACLPKLNGRSPVNARVRQDRDTWIITTTNPLPYAVRFLDDDVALIVIDSNASRAATDALLAGRATGLPSSASFTEMHARLHAATTWFVTTPPAILDLLPWNGSTAAFAAVDFRNGVAIDATVRFDTADNAQRAAKELNAQSAQTAMFVTRLDIATSGSDLTVGVMIGRDKLIALLATMVTSGAANRRTPMPVPPGGP
jgi:hypothetical protein